MKINLSIWKKGAQRAPHKPLLLLYALGRWSNGQREFSWLEVKEKVGYLIEQFGGNAKPDASNPFVRLRNDNEGKLWIIDGPLNTGAQGNPIVRELNENNNVSRFAPEFEELIGDPKEFDAVVNGLLVEHFSETQFEDLLSACGLQNARLATYKRKQRDPEFRQKVLDAYNHRCAICSYDLRFRSKLIGVEAAHIQWHNAQGPDIVANGVALCAVHHKLLDYGAIGLNDQLELMASRGLNGNDSAMEHYVFQYLNKPIVLPRNGMEEPAVEYVRWQRKEVFKD